MRAAIFCGSFDPFTLGHYEILLQASALFDKIYVAVAEETGKSGAMDLAWRIKIARKSVEDIPAAEVISFSGPLHAFCEVMHTDTLIRGLRNEQDYRFETQLLQVYQSQRPSIRAVYLLSQPALAHISSTVVRDLIRVGGSIMTYVCQNALPLIADRYRGR